MRRLLLAFLLSLTFAVPAVAAPPNVSKLVFPLAARTGDTESEVFKNPGYDCVWFVVEVTANGGLASVQPFLRIVDTVLNIEFDLAFANTILITTPGVYFFFMGTKANPNPSPGAADFMTIVPPNRFKMFMDHADAQSITYEASAFFTQASCDP